jgi:tetratricopeptide (TPR) repeat protein
MSLRPFLFSLVLAALGIQAAVRAQDAGTGFAAARAAYAAGNVAEALRQLEAIAARSPPAQWQAPDAHLLGMSLYLSGRLAEAQALWGELAARNLQDETGFEITFSLASVLLERGRKTEAYLALQRLSPSLLGSLGPALRQRYFLLAHRILAEMGKFHSAALVDGAALGALGDADDQRLFLALFKLSQSRLTDAGDRAALVAELTDPRCQAIAQAPPPTAAVSSPIDGLQLLPLRVLPAGDGEANPRLVLSGNYARGDWALYASGDPVFPGENGKFTLKLPIVNREARTPFLAIGPSNQQQAQVAEYPVSDPARFPSPADIPPGLQEEATPAEFPPESGVVTPAPAAAGHWRVGTGLGAVSYTQSGYATVSTLAAVVRAEGSYALGEKTAIGASGKLYAFSFAPHPTGATVRWVSGEVTATHRFSWGESAALRAGLGYRYATLLLSEGLNGFSNLNGPFVTAGLALRRGGGEAALDLRAGLDITNVGSAFWRNTEIGVVASYDFALSADGGWRLGIRAALEHLSSQFQQGTLTADQGDAGIAIGF